MPPALPESLQLLPVMAWCSSADGERLVGNACWQAATGTPAAGCSRADWLGLMHADDQAVVAALWTSSITAGTAFAAMARHRRHEGDFAWTQLRAVPVHGGDGALLHWVGIASDVDALKTSEIRAVLIANELAHRIGNIFAVVGGMLALSARDQPAAADFARATGARIAALATAHAFIWPPALCGDAAPQQVARLIGLLLEPYSVEGGPLIEITGDDAVVTGSAATCITLIIHELATNAAKHGALSCNDGRLRVRLRRTATQLTIVWAERGGPAIPHAPTRSGFGSGLIDRVTRMRPVARVRRWWQRDGLVMVLRIRLDPGEQ